MPAASAKNRHRPSLFCHLRARLDIRLHAASHQLRQRPVALARDALQVPEERFGKLDLRSCYEVNVMLPLF